MNELVIVGASGHGKVIADIAICNGYKDIKFLDDNTQVKTCLDFPVVGTSLDITKFPKADFIVAIGDPIIRRRLQKKISDCQLKVVSLIHPSAIVSRYTKIGRGTVVMAGAVINPGTEIGEGCIINTGATVDHDNKINDYVHISVGSHLAGTVTVGEATWVGIGVTVSNNISICENCILGAGSVVIQDIVSPGTYFGIPASRKKNVKN